MNQPNPKPSSERRSSLRLDTMFRVQVESLALGRDLDCVARNISRGGMMIQASFLIPLGSPVEVRFSLPGGVGATVFSARGHVRYHYYLHFGGPDRPGHLYGMGVRFLSFNGDGLQQLDRSMAGLEQGTLATVH